MANINLKPVYSNVLFVLLCTSFMQKDVPNAKVGFSKAMSAGWLSIDKSAEGGPRVYRKSPSISDVVQESLQALKDGQALKDSQLKDFKKRKLINKIAFIRQAFSCYVVCHMVWYNCMVQYN